MPQMEQPFWNKHLEAVKKQAAGQPKGMQFLIAATHLVETHPQISTLSPTERVEFAEAMVKKLWAGTSRLKAKYGLSKPPTAGEDFQSETSAMILKRLCGKAMVKEPATLSRHLLEIFSALKD